MEERKKRLVEEMQMTFDAVMSRGTDNNMVGLTPAEYNILAAWCATAGYCGNLHRNVKVFKAEPECIRVYGFRRNFEHWIDLTYENIG